MSFPVSALTRKDTENAGNLIFLPPPPKKSLPLPTSYLPWNDQAMKNKFFFTAGMIRMLSGVAFGATDGAEVDCGRDWSPYVTLRGGWLFGGDVKSDCRVSAHPENNGSPKKSIKNAWSGSGEFGVSCFNDRISFGLELGYFTKKAAFELLGGGGGKLIFPAEFGNTFGACNVALRHYFGERGFWYGAVGRVLCAFP